MFRIRVVLRVILDLYPVILQRERDGDDGVDRFMWMWLADGQ